MEASEIFKKRLRELIASRGVTQAELAAACGISPSWLGSNLGPSVVSNPTASTLIALGKFFGVTPDYLLGIDSRPPPSPPDPPPPRRAVAEVVEGKTTAALALAGAYSVLCLAAWLLT